MSLPLIDVNLSCDVLPSEKFNVIILDFNLDTATNLFSMKLSRTFKLVNLILLARLLDLFSDKYFGV